MWIDCGKMIDEAAAADLRRSVLRKLEIAVEGAIHCAALKPVGAQSVAAQIAFIQELHALLDQGRRGSGRTTAAVLDAVAAALRDPDQWVTVQDSTIADQSTAEAIAELIRAECPFGLQLDVERSGFLVRVRSPLSRVRVAQRVPE